MDEDQLRQIYEMVDSIPFSRAKKNINRDFSDGVMMAELVHHYRPKAVELHSYPTASSTSKKVNNWLTLNTKVLKKLGIGLSKAEIEDIVNCVPMAIETYLYSVLSKFESPGEEANLRQQIRKVNTTQSPKHMDTLSPKRVKAGGEQGNAEGRDKTKSFRNNLIGAETDEVEQLVDEIEEAYAQLLKLQELSKIKDEMIKNLEKKVQKMVFS